MYSPQVFEELAKATTRAREEEVRQIRLQRSGGSGSRSAIRACLARTLVHAGMRLDGSVVEIVRRPDGTAAIKSARRSA